MITRRGSQAREPIEEAEYKVIERNDDGTVILLDTYLGCRELWQANDDFAGYVVVIDGTGYEFVRSLE